jgi:ribosomal protein L11 methyltransferase
MDMPAYHRLLLPEGKLVLSGFYSEDLDAIKQKAQQYGLDLQSFRTKNNWVSAVFLNA